MNEYNFQFRQYSILTWFITLLLFFIGLMFFVYNSNYIYTVFHTTTQQTYSLIFALTISVFIIVGINIYFSKVISILINVDFIKITDLKSNKSTVFSKENILNYNISISRKGWLDVLRLKIDDKNRYYWLGGINWDKLDETDILNKKNLLKVLEKEFPTKKKNTNIDTLILFSGTKLHYIFLVIALIMIIGICLYIIY